MIEEKVRELFVAEGIIVATDDINERLEIDSLRFVSIIVQIEETFDVVIPDEYLSSSVFSTLSDYVKLVELLKED